MERPPRRPWLAALLSLASPGLGQLYNGRAAKALLFFAGVPLAHLGLIESSLFLPRPPLNILLPLLAAVLVQVAAAFDAHRDARGLRDAPRPWYGRWYALVPAWLIASVVFVPLLARAFTEHAVQAFKIPTGGMERTLRIGDHVLVDKRDRGASRLAVIAFRYPEDRSVVFLKRVIGLPGEKVELHGKTVSIDGAPLGEPYAYFVRGEDGEDRGDWGPETIPEGQLFVLGDNRDNNRDSRMFGFVPAADVVGVARVVYYSRNDREGEDQRVRWERIGQRVR